MATGTANLESTGNLSEERFIQQQLDRTRRQVKLVDLFGGLLLLAVGVLGFLLLVAVVDAWLFDLGRWGRVLALLTIVCGGLAYLAIYVVPLLFRKVNPVYAARTIERAQPTLKNGLINFLMFRSQPKQVEQVVYRELEHEAAVGLSHVPIETAVDRSKLIRLGCVFAGVLVACAVYSIASPKNPLTTFARVAAPLADIDRPTRVQIDHRMWKRRVTDVDVKSWKNHSSFKQLRRNDWLVRFDNDDNSELSSESSGWSEVSTGSLQVFYGDRVGVEAVVHGIGDDTVTMTYSTSDHNGKEITLESDGSYYQQVLSPTSAGIQEDLSCYLSAGDSATRKFDIRVSTAPTITVDRIQYDFPAYTNLPQQLLEGQANVKALEGTKVTVTATANLPIKSAEIELRATSNPESPRRNQSVTMSVKDGQAVGQFVLELRADGETPVYSEYVVRFTTAEGQENRDPDPHGIEVIPDLSPEVEILTPQRERIEVPVNRSQTIEVRALDPDFALRQVSLHAASAGADLLNVVLLDARATTDKEKNEAGLSGKDSDEGSTKDLGHLGQAVATYEFRPASLKLKPGDEVVFWAMAQDNRTGARHQLPEPNVSRTSNFYIKITPPETGRGPDAKSDSPEKKDKNDSRKENGDDADSKGGGGQSGAQSTGAGNADQGDSGEADSGNASGGASSGSESSNADASERGDGGSQGKSSPSGGSPSGDSQSGGSNSSDSGSSKSSQGESGTNEERNAAANQDGTADSFESSGGNAGEGAGNSEISGKPDLDNANVKRNEDIESQESDSDEPLHDGEVFEKILEHLKNNKEDAAGNGKSSNSQQGNKSDNGGKPDQDNSSSTPSAEGSSGNTASSQPNGQGASNNQGTDQAGSKKSESPADSRGSQTGEKQGEIEGSRNHGDQPDGGQSGDPRGPNETHGENANERSQSDKKDGNGQGETGNAGAGRKDEGETGSPQAQGENGDRDKATRPDGGGSKQGEEAKSPSTSNKQSNSQGENAGDRSGGGGEGGGQDANQAGRDTAGSNSSADSGAGASNESGQGETSGRGGNDQTAEGKTESGSDQSGNGSGSRAEPKSDKVVKRPGDSPGSQAANPHGGSGGIGDTQNASGLSDAKIAPGEKAKLEYAEKATDLALDYLRDQKAGKDRKLLDELGWTEEELNSFIDRWSQLKRKAKEGASEERNELSRSLRSLGLRPAGDKRRAASDQSDQFRDLRDEGFRETLPAKYLEQFKAFQRGAARAENSR